MPVIAPGRSSLNSTKRLLDGSRTQSVERFSRTIRTSLNPSRPTSPSARSRILPPVPLIPGNENCGVMSEHTKPESSAAMRQTLTASSEAASNSSAPSPSRSQARAATHFPGLTESRPANLTEEAVIFIGEAPTSGVMKNRSGTGISASRPCLWVPISPPRSMLVPPLSLRYENRSSKGRASRSFPSLWSNWP
ncbi:MAG: hypothetical protein BWY06_01165 [Candidatus Latescibacteria bacterium ADurb.Bin168]|nr:MAG: hypothetical protein BWY06_01165 [Candidatus Latescibacteria bacterium ADurb.Bin168]